MRSNQPAQSTFDRRHAAVIGGSMAGLLAARVLSDHFAQVTMIERDQLRTASALAHRNLRSASSILFVKIRRENR